MKFGAKLILAILVLQTLFAGLEAQKKKGKGVQKGKGVVAGKGVGGRTAEAVPPEPEAPAPPPPEEPAPPPPAPEEPPPAAEAAPPAEGAAASHSPGSSGGNGTKISNTEFDEDADPSPDPFHDNKKWSNFVHRIDAIIEELKKATKPLATLLSSNAEPLDTFNAKFSAHFNPLKKFFDPLYDELVDGAAYTQVNPAVGLTDLKKLNEWAQNPPEKFLDKARLKWVQVNAMAITAHHVFDRLKPIIEKWGLEDIRDWTVTGYPTYLEGVSGYEGGDRATYELKLLEDLTSTINTEMDANGEKGHMMRSLEKILRKHINTWDPESDYNIFCFGNNEFGIIHDVFDLLTDAAMYLSLADMKHAVLRATHHVFVEYEAAIGAIGDGLTDASKARPAADLTGKFDEIFTEMKARIDKKIRIASIAPSVDPIIPGPSTFKCDKPPGDTGADPTPDQPEGHSFPEGYKPERLRPNQKPPTFPQSQWGKPQPDPLSPKNDDKTPEPHLDSQSGPEHPLPSGYIDNRPAKFDFASFSQAYMGYLEAETVLNPDGSCKSTCPDYRRPTPTCENKTIDCPGYRREYCEPGKDNCLEKSTCNSEARNCIRTSFEVNFCPSAKSDRLYDWVEINGTLVGKDVGDESKDCGTEVMKVRERWEMDYGVILSAPQYCEVCMCICDQPMNAEGIHHFDIQPVVAAEGHVITAIKFIQEDNVIRLNAEQGKLGEDGHVDQETVSWIETPAPDKSDASKTPRLGVADGFRRIGLDMVYATTHEVITGVKFVLTGGTLHLAAQTSPVNPETGALAGSGGEWKESNYPPPEPQKRKIHMDDKVSSIRQLGPSQPFGKPDNSKIIEFDASSLLLDAGQAVIPFFDLQTARHHTVRKPLNAVGLLYKSKKGFGGFISPTVTYTRKFFV